jgi:hypothetical protein
MPWPAHLIQIVNRGDDPVSRVVRASLAAMTTSVRETVYQHRDTAPDEPALALLLELEDLLAAPGSGPGPGPVTTGSPPARQAASRAIDRLAAVVSDMTADPAVRAEAGEQPLAGQSPDELWSGAQRRLLRVSPELAERWRSVLMQEMQECGVGLDSSRCAAICSPSTEDRVLYPGLVGVLSASGLRSTPAAGLDPRVGRPGTGTDLELMARLVSIALWFSDHDVELHHCLQAVYRFGIIRLAGDQRDRFTEELLNRWRRVVLREAQPGTTTGTSLQKQTLIEWIELDEALHSLVYLPPALASSWWSRFQGEARLALYRARDRAIEQGCQARLQRLGGPFPAISKLVGSDNLEVEHGTPGEVAVCLRVFARIDGEELRGRVLYRPF